MYVCICFDRSEPQGLAHMLPHPHRARTYAPFPSHGKELESHGHATAVFSTASHTSTRQRRATAVHQGTA